MTGVGDRVEGGRVTVVVERGVVVEHVGLACV